MRRLVVLLVFVGATLALAAAPASASTVPVSGTFTATGTVDFTCPAGGFVQQIVDGTSTLSPLGSSSLHLDYCVALPSGLNWPVVNGAFSITTPEGELTGTIGGYVQANNQTPQGFPLHLELTVVAGTSTLQGATGHIVLDGFFGQAGLTASGTVSGTLTLPNPTPKTKNDCKNGGWRTLVDDQGRSFQNQGQCVSWAVHHTG